MLSGSSSENRRRWEQRLQLYMIASGAVDTVETVKIALLLHAVGEGALEVYNTLTVTAAGRDMTTDDLLKALKDYCGPLKNGMFERRRFWSHTSTGTSVDRFITELRRKSED